MLPEVLLICVDCTEEEIIKKVNEINYNNLDVKQVCIATDGLKKLLEIIRDTKCQYVCFGVNDKISNPERISKMARYLEKNKELDAVLCLSQYVDDEGVIALHMSDGLMRYIKEKKYLEGWLLLLITLKMEENILGSLENCMFRKAAYITKVFLLDRVKIRTEDAKMFFALENVCGMKVGVLREALVTCHEKPLDVVKLYNDYSRYQELRNQVLHVLNYGDDISARGLPDVYRKITGNTFQSPYGMFRKEKRITFFCMDKAEYNNLRPIGEEAVKRGYQVEFTGEVEKSVEIGVYCSHVGCIVNAGKHAKFSVILLHDLTQGELNWPNLWYYEPWNDFELGILPGKEWSKRWKRCSGFHYAHPRFGVYELGYPKGDCIKTPEFKQHVNSVRESLGLKYRYSVLYAPSWENDGKEDDFVKAVEGLKVNMLIKQAPWKGYDNRIYANIQEMQQMHEGRYDNIYYMNPEEDIFTALDICDLVVSDESSVMTEALLFGKPSIAVWDWIIPEETPRYAYAPIDYVHKCSKKQLGECVEQMLNRIEAGEKQEQVDGVFSNIGHSASDIMDLIEFYVGDREECGCLNKEVRPIHMLHGLWDC